jgi:aminopeptidase-like protein
MIRLVLLFGVLNWVDFKVEIGPNSILKKVGVVSEETEKAYGQAVIKFADLCDGQTSLEDVVRKINVSLQAMKFVATKLVLDGVLEIVA